MVQRITIDASQQQDQQIVLHADQLHYLRRVLRLEAGDQFIAQDGKGQQWLAALSVTSDSADVIECLAAAVVSAMPIRLIAALPKGNGFDAVVRQATELGVSHIYPVISDRTLLRPKGNRLDRWRRIANEASEQSERVTVPDIAPPTHFVQIFKQNDWEGLRYICATRRNAPHLLAKLQNDLISEDLLGVNLMIGPEGGWTSDEITVAIRESYKAVSLGPAILRATTASITALSLVAAARELLI